MALSISLERVFSFSGGLCLQPCCWESFTLLYHLSPFLVFSSSKYPLNFLLLELLGETTLISTNLLGKLFQFSWSKLIVSACGFL